MNRIKYLLIMLALACGGGNGDGGTEAAGAGGSTAGAGGAAGAGAECDLSGEWSLTYRLGEGDCADPGEPITDTMTVTETTVKDSHGEYPVTAFNERACSIDATYTELVDETPDSYGTISEMRVVLNFDGDEVFGTGEMNIGWTEDDVVVDSCTRAYEIEGTR